MDITALIPKGNHDESAIWEKMARQQENGTATGKLHKVKPSAI